MISGDGHRKFPGIFFYFIADCCKRGGLPTGVYVVNSWNAGRTACVHVCGRKQKKTSAVIPHWLFILRSDFGLFQIFFKPNNPED